MIRNVLGALFLLSGVIYGWYTVAAAAAKDHRAFWDYAWLNTANKFELVGHMWAYSPAATIAIPVLGLIGVAFFVPWELYTSRKGS
jgi:hypothetical protein